MATWVRGLVFFAVAGVICWLAIEQYRPKRVFIRSAEKLEDTVENQVFSTTDRSIDAEERFQAWIAGTTPCLVLTRNKDRADFLVHIDVTRYNPVQLFGAGNELWADGQLSVLRSNGDVVLNEYFFQGTGMWRAKDDIGQQPLKRVRELLCPCCAKDF